MTIELVSFRGARVARKEVEVLKEFEEDVGFELNLYDFHKVNGEDYTEFAVERGHVVALAVVACHLEMVSWGIDELTHLRVLLLGHNHLEGLPQEISKLKTLYELRVNDNAMTMSTYDVAGMDSLVILDLTNNNLDDIPEGLEQLPNLKECLLFPGNEHLHKYEAPVIASLRKRGVKLEAEDD